MKPRICLLPGCHELSRKNSHFCCTYHTVLGRKITYYKDKKTGKSKPVLEYKGKIITYEENAAEKKV